MPQYSKQWCEVNNLDSNWKFDIEEVAKQLPPNSYYPVVCDGFGFTAIGNSTEFGTMVYFKNGIGLNTPPSLDTAEWVKLEELLQTNNNENNGDK